MDRINKQDMIVANVFPSAIRDRLYLLLAPEAIRAQWDLLHWQTSFPILPSSLPTSLVETVGDCYVAAAGLPDPMDDHAVVACKFARKALETMKEITNEMEISLGPDTVALELRVGIHSGQVTAGVLRGERSRFQLFGDTMNTASRMESSGERDSIQVTQATADLLKEAGYVRWLIPRSSRISVKGKGKMQTSGFARRNRLSRRDLPSWIVRCQQSMKGNELNVMDQLRGAVASSTLTLRASSTWQRQN
eukprot:scaffold27023_cov147-Cylindrotheca_fusiformis.AAC.1